MSHGSSRRKACDIATKELDVADGGNVLVVVQKKEGRNPGLPRYTSSARGDPQGLIVFCSLNQTKSKIGTKD